ncbi:unnamed protein product [Hymenolepis diminuta]|uniref:Uncharacterized protein n=1 Tax=Hymenolepis diminuta TaxID=6216 RepID=A0A0R3SX72_HYMDI|nr:unnamed protein product [Hymenolepis diminuta]
MFTYTEIPDAAVEKLIMKEVDCGKSIYYRCWYHRKLVKRLKIVDFLGTFAPTFVLCWHNQLQNSNYMLGFGLDAWIGEYRKRFPK